MQLKGRIIVATLELDGSWFEKAVIFITGQNEKGITGFVVNKPFPRKLNELEEFKHAAAIDLYNGGPVGNEHIYFLHTRPALLQGTKITAEIYFGGDFHKAVELLSSGKLSASEVKIFVGYCGWDAGELESEIEEGSWKIKDAFNLFTNLHLPNETG